MGIFNKYNRWFSYLFISLEGEVKQMCRDVTLCFRGGRELKAGDWLSLGARFLLIPNISALAFRFALSAPASAKRHGKNLFPVGFRTVPM